MTACRPFPRCTVVVHGVGRGASAKLTYAIHALRSADARRDEVLDGDLVMTPPAHSHQDVRSIWSGCSPLLSRHRAGRLYHAPVDVFCTRTPSSAGYRLRRRLAPASSAGVRCGGRTCWSKCCATARDAIGSSRRDLCSIASALLAGGPAPRPWPCASRGDDLWHRAAVSRSEKARRRLPAPVIYLASSGPSARTRGSSNSRRSGTRWRLSDRSARSRSPSSPAAARPPLLLAQLNFCSCGGGARQLGMSSIELGH